MFILDDHALFREGLIRLFKSDPAFDIVGNSGAPSEAWNPLLSEQPDVLILDYDLGTVCSLDLVRQLRTDRFQGRVLMVTAQPSEVTTSSPF